jgi:hypothetical protein
MRNLDARQNVCVGGGGWQGGESTNPNNRIRWRHPVFSTGQLATWQEGLMSTPSVSK